MYREVYTPEIPQWNPIQTDLITLTQKKEKDSLRLK
uniref:Uncharacterized protein n=1 Tax=Anguilla anguilla TaxID=7936 RepID=A0A0E9U330_ANGAN